MDYNTKLSFTFKDEFLIIKLLHIFGKEIVLRHGHGALNVLHTCA